MNSRIFRFFLEKVKAKLPAERKKRELERRVKEHALTLTEEINFQLLCAQLDFQTYHQDILWVNNITVTEIKI